MMQPSKQSLCPFMIRIVELLGSPVAEMIAFGRISRRNAAAQEPRA